MNYTYSSCVLTYLSLLVIISNTTGVAHLKTDAAYAQLREIRPQAPTV